MMIELQNIEHIKGAPKFSLRAANQLIPVVYHITEKAHAEFKLLSNQLSALKAIYPNKVSAIEIQMQRIVETWETKMLKLGVLPKGLWIADFDNGQGYYCWKFPEVEIKFQHGYNDGFSGRKAVTEDENSSSPN